MSYNSSTIRTLRVMHWNAQGITNRSNIAQLQHFLNEKQIDLLFINETFLKSHHKFKLTNYKVYRKDRRSHGGGVLIAIKYSIPHQLISSYSTTVLENVSLKLQINNRPVRFTAAYNPRFSSSFLNDIKKITTDDGDFFIFGDLNALHTSWHCIRNNSAGNCLYNHQLQSNFYIHAPNSFTRFGQRTSFVQPSVVDILLTNSSLQISNIRSHPGILPSDHVPISCDIFGSVEENIIKIPQYNRANWDEIRNWVDCKLECLHSVEITTNNIEQRLSLITKTLQEVNNKIPTVRKLNNKNNLSKLSVYLIGQRKRFTRKLQRAHDPDQMILLKSLIKRISQLIDENVSNDVNNNWNTFLSKLPAGSKNFWRVSRAMRCKITAVETLTVDGVDMERADIKANVIADTFERAHKITHSDHSAADRKVVQHVQWLNSQSITIEPYDLTTAEEVKFHTISLKNKKSPGLDGIKPLIIKRMSDNFFVLLTQIFNWCLCNGYFPQTFKAAKVIPILKKGKAANLASSYRPISMLTVIDKVFEKIILSRVKRFTEQNNIIHKYQFGFREGLSTIHQLKRVLKLITDNKVERKSTGVVLLDIEKAFDTVWHNGLVYKLNEFNFPIFIQKMIKSFLEKRSFFVYVDGQKSSMRTINAGVPQGAILSPILYSIFTSDFKIGKEQSVAFYADDSALISSGKVSNAIVKNMKKGLMACQRYFKKWKIKINHNKTQAIIFPYNKSPRRIPSLALSVNGSDIPLLDSVKYLGITFDKKLNFKHHIIDIADKAIKCGRALYPLINKRSLLTPKNKILLYKMCIRPIMAYGCQIWFKRSAASNLKKLQIIQNKNLKTILKLHRRFSTRTLHETSKQPTVSSYLAELTQRFEMSCRFSPYEEIRNLIR